MSNLEKKIIDKVRSHLSPIQMENGVIYLDPILKLAGEQFAVGDVVIKPPWTGYVAFTDLEPKANWGHNCLYLLIREDGSELVEYAAQMPPFLKPGSSHFKLLVRGHSVPEWAVTKNDS